jgi:hypothetical protein
MRLHPNPRPYRQIYIRPLGYIQIINKIHTFQFSFVFYFKEGNSHINNVWVEAFNFWDKNCRVK